MKAWRSYWQFYKKAGTIYTNQSPIQHRFYEEVLRQGRTPHPTLAQLNAEFFRASREDIILHRTDFGTGLPRTETVSHIAQNQVSSIQDLNTWFRLSSFVQPDTILELGTSLGWSSAYFARGNSNGKVITVEGDLSLVNYANQLHRSLDVVNTQIIHSSFDRFFENHSNIHPDLVFIDGNHTFEATTKYVDVIIQRLAKNGLIVVHDVLWSNKMYQAWNAVINHPGVTASLQFENVGFLFTDESFLAKIDETWIRWYLKPWTKYLTW